MTATILSPERTLAKSPVEALFENMMPAWKGIGKDLSAYTDTREAYRNSGLAWTTKIGPLHDHLNRPIPGRVTIHRMEDNEVLGIATDFYTPIQNRTMFDLGDALQADGRATYCHAGELLGGRKTFLLLQLPDEINVNGDKTDCFLLMTNGHDGNTGFTGWMVRVRRICSNGMVQVMAGKAAFKIEHSGNTTGRLVEAAKAVRVMNAANRRFEEWLKKLDARAVNQIQLGQIQEAIWPGIDPLDPDADGMKRNQILKWREVWDLEAAEFGPTAYTTLNSITAMADHFIPVRSRPGGDQKMVAMLDGIVFDWKARGMKAMEKVLGVPSMESVEKASVSAGAA